MSLQVRQQYQDAGEPLFTSCTSALAHAGYSTLLVDTDAQSHATFWFVNDPSEIHYDLQDIDKNEVPIAKVIRPIRIDGLDLLPATLALAPFELELATFP